jgi:hypothetical protein
MHLIGFLQFRLFFSLQKVPKVDPPHPILCVADDDDGMASLTKEPMETFVLAEAFVADMTRESNNPQGAQEILQIVSGACLGLIGWMSVPCCGR